MAKTDTSERWFEARVVRGLTGVPQPEYSHALAPTDFAATHNGYVQGKPADYNRDVALDVAQLLAFLQATQPKAVEALELAADGIKRTQFLHRLQGEITKRGVVDVLRKGVSHGPVHVDLYKLLPTPGNAAAADAFGKNIFSVTRQVRYSNDSGNELDLAIFINGLPVLTFELKNSLTKQTLADAIVQYQTTRSPQELLFQLGRCVAHIAVDDAEAAFCTELKGKASWFLPFNQGWNSGAGNPPNPDGLKTDYLWKQVLNRESLANIIESYAQVVEEEEADASGKKRKKRKQIFPRFHQLRTVRALHVYFATPYNDWKMWENALVQLSFTLLWVSLAFICMLTATKRNLRSLWIFGGCILVLVTLKLVLFDLSHIGTLTRVISFLGAGLVMLVIAYIAPMPELEEKTN